MNESGHDRPVARAVTADLLSKYDQPAPRYTSYPTAVEFHENFGAADYEKALEAANDEGQGPLSVYIHLPFCDHRCLYCGCHVIISPRHERAAPYLDLLQREVDAVGQRLPKRKLVSQLHLGGGTPTYYSPNQLDRLVSHVLQVFEPAPGAELALEIDPRVTSKEHLDVLAGHGFNRVSLGVQDFTPEVQEAVERIQSPEQTAELIEHARKRGFTGINIDLIYGLPMQTPDTFEKTVETVVDMGADRVAVYSFAFVPWMRAHMKKLDALPDRNNKFTLFATARERFMQAGYEPIGMDHFAKPSDELSVARREGRLRRNFMGYTVIPSDTMIGLGISAIGDVGGAYVQNQKKLSDYEPTLSKSQLPVERGVRRTADDDVRRTVIHELMCNFVVHIPNIESQFGVQFATYFKPDLQELAQHEREGLVEIQEDRIVATPTGELFVRNLALCFDRYWRERHRDEDKPIFSRSV